MRKYIVFFIVFIFSTPIFLQAPFIVQLSTAANAVNVTCTCQNNKVVGQGKNGFTCNGPAPNPSACSQSYQACVDTPGHLYQKQAAGPTIHGQPGSPEIDWYGVACGLGQTTTGKQALECQCTGAKNQNGKQTSIQCRNNTDTNPTWKTYSCGGNAICQQPSSLYYTWTDNGSAKVPGIACEQNCICQGTKGVAGTKSGVGDGNNGKQCYNSDGTLGAVQTYCTHREEYCQNDPNATDGIKCVDNTSCTCNAGKTAINCVSKGSGQDAEGNAVDQTFTVDCSSSNKQCQTGPNINDPNFTAFNQPVHNIACEPLPSLPPNPSPPCAAWSGGTCTSFDTGIGLMSTGTTGFVSSLFSALLSVSGGIALLLIIRAGYQLMTAQGKPEQLQQGRDQLIAAIVGLIFLIFSFVFLQLIGFDILHLPGFGAGDTATPQQCSGAGLQYCSKTQQCLPASSTCP